MSTQKESTNTKSTLPTEGQFEVGRNDTSGVTELQAVEVVSLEIADEFDSGGDPYNRTGSFCVIKNPDEK
jgi:hypothetical protein